MPESQQQSSRLWRQETQEAPARPRLSRLPASSVLSHRQGAHTREEG